MNFTCSNCKHSVFWHKEGRVINYILAESTGAYCEYKNGKVKCNCTGFRLHAREKNRSADRVARRVNGIKKRPNSLAYDILQNKERYLEELGKIELTKILKLKSY